MTSLLPRLSPVEARELLGRAEFGTLTPDGARALTFDSSRGIRWAATGGHQDPQAFRRIANELRAIATRCGFPDRNSEDARRKFDLEATIALAQVPELRSGEALRNDVWACLSLVGAPDVALWRYPSSGTDRLSGGVRNVFQRLWTRGISLDRGESSEDRWGLIRLLSEDAMVQIFERPAIARDRRLTRALAEAWVRAAKRYGASSMESVMRNAVRQLRIRNVIQGISLLDDPALDSCLDGFFSPPN
jgi:hypothetical protein